MIPIALTTQLALGANSSHDECWPVRQVVGVG
jgi:hypothetical protein